MLTKTQEQIIAFLLSHPEEKLTIRSISRRLNKSYTLVYNNIHGLEKDNLITKESVPPAQIVKLNEFAPMDTFVEIELKRKKEFLGEHLWIRLMLEDVLSSAKNLFFIMLVFGSYAKATQTKKSDIDLLVIVQDKKDIKDIENAINKAYARVKKGLNFVDVHDFKEMIKNTNELNIGNEAKKHHIILYGAEEYYQLLKRIYKR